MCFAFVNLKTTPMLILGIESSCDETAVALVDDTRRIHANVIRSQYEHHAPYGGVVPEIAARAHIEWMEPILSEALQTAGVSVPDVDAIAVTAGPGLIGGVIVGVMTAKTLASVYRKPLVAVNHLEGHALTPRLTNDVAFPYLLLLVSGGHFIYAIVRGVGDYVLLGRSIDDALGEAFDKCAKMMGLGYPGGPKIEQMAKQGNPQAFNYPMPLRGTAGCDASFSGLKTAVRLSLRSMASHENDLTDAQRADVAASFQHTVIEILKERTTQAIRMAKAQGFDGLPLVVAGGVAANQAIGGALQALAAGYGMGYVAPPPALCTDNAAMIAWAGLERFRLGLTDGLDTEPRARWPLAA